MDPVERIEAALEHMPVFPLPDAVLLPGTSVPFHIFEPRYRALVADALEGPRALAIPMIARHGVASDAAPPLRRVAGAGVILRARPLPDGRYNILVRGVVRVALEEERPSEGRPYRTWRVRPIPDIYPRGGPPALAAEDQALRSAVLELCRLHRQPLLDAFARRMMRARGPAAAADLAASQLVASPEQRQRLLETGDVEARLAVVLDAVASLLVAARHGRHVSN